MCSKRGGVVVRIAAFEVDSILFLRVNGRLPVFTMTAPLGLLDRLGQQFSSRAKAIPEG